jgi:hypothetical protein
MEPLRHGFANDWVVSHAFLLADDRGQFERIVEFAIGQQSGDVTTDRRN